MFNLVNRFKSPIHLCLEAQNTFYFLLVELMSKWFYIITQVILAFSLVLAYDLLEDRRTIDVIVKKYYPPFFKMKHQNITS